MKFKLWYCNFIKICSKNEIFLIKHTEKLLKFIIFLIKFIILDVD